jgi:hypothetical protein
MARIYPIVSWLLEAGLKRVLTEADPAVDRAALLEQLLNVPERHIITCQIKYAFVIPGDYLVDGVHRTPGYRSKVSTVKGEHAVIRWDEREKHVDFDYNREVWRLRLDDFEQLKAYLKPPTHSGPGSFLTGYRDGSSQRH